MTRAQFIALLVAVGGAGFGVGGVAFSPGPPPGAYFTHLLDISRNAADGGDTITAYRTLAVLEPDGGADLTDVGPADCTGGDTAAIRAWVLANCRTPLEDGGQSTPTNVRAIEARPVLGQDGGASVELSVYGDGFDHCLLRRTAALRSFVDGLTCTQRKYRSGGQPL